MYLAEMSDFRLKKLIRVKFWSNVFWYYYWKI